MPDLLVTELDGILWARMNRPTKANSISREVTDLYAAALEELARKPELKGLIWTCDSETVFSGGVDLKRPEGFDDQQASEWRTAIINDLVMATMNCRRPVVTAARGRMIGGAFLNAISCDRIVASEDATFQLPEVKIGIGSPIAASIVQHSTNVALAQDMLLSAREMNAAELAAAGGPCTPVQAGELEAKAVETIETYAGMPAEAFAYMKAWFQKPRLAALEAAIRHTAATRTGKNDEATASVARFFAKP